MSFFVLKGVSKRYNALVLVLYFATYFVLYDHKLHLGRSRVHSNLLWFILFLWYLTPNHQNCTFHITCTILEMLQAMK